MPNPLNVLPDDELALIQYLRGLTAVTALITAGNIITELPPTPVYPYVLLQRAGGMTSYPSATDEPAIQVDTLAADRHTAKVLMLTVRAAILAIANDTVAAGILSSAYEEVGPAWLPDTVSIPPVPRYVARFRVLLHN